MPRLRIPLSHVGGPITTSGDPAIAARLARAMDVSPGLPERATHGFHPYAARMHPDLAARAIVDFSRPGDTVLDPMCGSGTTLIEAMIAGRRAIGTDLSPVAVLITKVATWLAPAAARRALVQRGTAIARAAAERARRREEPPDFRPPGAREFRRHLLPALSWLRVMIAGERDGDLRRAFECCFSALLLQASDREYETGKRRVKKALPPTAPADWFGQRCVELARRLEEFASLVPRGTPPARVEEADARDLRRIPDGSVDLVLTSPPYPGVYDYARIHALRAAWLGLDDRDFARGEIGARRGRVTARTTESTYVLASGWRALRPGGVGLVLAASSQRGGLTSPFEFSAEAAQLPRDHGIAAERLVAFTRRP